jgi:hypothetical protein
MLRREIYFGMSTFFSPLPPPLTPLGSLLSPFLPSSSLPLPQVYFDGASKGDLGPSSLGEVFISNDFHLLWIITDYIGKSTNNATELQDLEKCLTMHLVKDSVSLL